MKAEACLERLNGLHKVVPAKSPDSVVNTLNTEVVAAARSRVLGQSSESQLIVQVPKPWKIGWLVHTAPSRSPFDHHCQLNSHPTSDRRMRPGQLSQSGTLCPQDWPTTGS